MLGRVADYHDVPSSAQRWRLLSVVASMGLGVLGFVGAIYYLGGFYAASISTAAIVVLVAWGNYVLNNTIEL